MEGLSKLENLRVLDVSSNKLTSINDIENLTRFEILKGFGIPRVRRVSSLRFLLLCRLEDLWLNDNQITSLEGIDQALSGSKEKLTTIYLERNPCVWFSFLFG